MSDPDTAPLCDSKAAQYQVLARKCRPYDFSGLIGQEAMVRTLTNAIDSGRLAHAFILTGVRGVGKTTTARIIARALNCEEGPTPTPCGVCKNCQAIAQGRHMDVLEMDAASRTGVDDIRELIESVRYRPTGARYKVYIVDEIHMLSKNAFNALLKTLEEPPEHVKFIFATTEIRKVPVTVLSRCQRFDLKRLSIEALSAHFSAIAQKEGAKISSGALHLISRAADGSVRDGLSLLDQAIAHTDGEISEEQVRNMLGLADRTRIFDLFDVVMNSDIKEALAQVAGLYNSGADPVVILTDLLELTHWITRIKAAPETAKAPGVPEAERVRGCEMAGKLSMATLARTWQMLLKGLSEAQSAPSPLQATEMALVRLAYAADLPTPAETIKALKESGEKAIKPQTAPQQPAKAPVAMMEAHRANPDPKQPDGFQAIVDLAEERREAILHANLVNNVHLVAFEPGRIEFRPTSKAPETMAYDISGFLNASTDRRWVVTVSNEAGEPTLRQQEDAAEAALKAHATEHPEVQTVLEAFPEASIKLVKRKNA